MTGAPIHGVLVVDKPAGPTSHDIVDRVRRALRERRVGHTGTLDPFATGVLVGVVVTAGLVLPLATLGRFGSEPRPDVPAGEDARPARPARHRRHPRLPPPLSGPGRGRRRDHRVY